MAMYRVLRQFWSNEHKQKFDPKKTPQFDFDDAWVESVGLTSPMMVDGKEHRGPVLEKMETKRGRKPKQEEPETEPEVEVTE